MMIQWAALNLVGNKVALALVFGASTHQIQHTLIQ